LFTAIPLIYKAISAGGGTTGDAYGGEGRDGGLQDELQHLQPGFL
jgi:hypothetical protein